MMTWTRIRIRASFLWGTCRALFSQCGETAVDSSPIKVLADNPVGQLPQFISIVIQIVAMVKQQLRELRQHLPQRVFVLQLHKCPWAAAVLEWPTSFPCDAEGILLRGIKGKNL